MRNIEILELLNAGRVEEVKDRLRDEIYTEALGTKAGAKKRYNAMKKYFTYINSVREALQKPCLIEYNGKNYISFCNGYTLTLTTEPCGAVELLDDSSNYPDVTRLIRLDGEKRKVDFKKVFAEAKSKGYKLIKNEVDSYKFKYLIRYDGAYFKMGLLDATFAIIDDGEEATVCHETGERTQLTIETSIGVCVVMPIRLEEITNDLVVIDVK